MTKNLSCALLIGVLSMMPASARAQSTGADAKAFSDYAGTEYRVNANLTYLTASGVELKLDIYRPRTAAAPLPTVVFFHGGGWALRAKKEGAVLQMLPWIQRGWNAVNVEYRPSAVAPAPAALEDARCAVRWVARNAKQYNVDPDRIVTSGQSAGGHLALAAAMAPLNAGFDTPCPGTPVKVAAVVNWYGVWDFAPIYEDTKYPWAITWIAGRKDVASHVSPITYARGGLPPTITIHGDADTIVPYQQGVQGTDTLKKAGVSAELVSIPGGRHGNFERSQVLRAWAAIDAFLARAGLTKTTSAQR